LGIIPKPPIFDNTPANNGYYKLLNDKLVTDDNITITNEITKKVYKIYKQVYNNASYSYSLE